MLWVSIVMKPLNRYDDDGDSIDNDLDSDDENDDVTVAPADLIQQWSQQFF